jgi:hypothetical protein
MLHYSSIGSRDAPSAAGAAAAATGGGSSGNELLLPKSMQTPRGKHAHSVLEYSSTHHEGMATSSTSIGMGKGTGSDGTSSFTGGSIGSSTASASSTTGKRRQSFDLPSTLGGGGVVGAAALSLSLSHTQGKTPSLAIDRALQQASSGCAAVQAAEAEAEAAVAAAAALEIEVDDPAAAAAAARHQQRQSGRVSVSGLVAERLGG